MLHTSTILDTMHTIMALVRHNWKHGIAVHIKTDAVALAVTEKLRADCNVYIDIEKISDNVQSAAQNVALPGEQSLKVAQVRRWRECVCVCV